MLIKAARCDGLFNRIDQVTDQVAFQVAVQILQNALRDGEIGRAERREGRLKRMLSPQTRDWQALPLEMSENSVCKCVPRSSHGHGDPVRIAQCWL